MYEKKTQHVPETGYSSNCNGNGSSPGGIPVPDEGEHHLDAPAVTQLLARGLTEESSRRVVGHLLGGCGVCRDRAREGLRRAGEEAAAYDAAFDRAVAAVLGKGGRLLDARSAEVAAGAALWEKLREQPPGRRCIMVGNSPRYRTAGLLEALFRDYREGLWRDPAEGLELAELAMTIAEGLDAGKIRASRLADLQAEALAIAGNANRLAACPREARRLLRQAALRLRLGRGGLLLEGQVLGYPGGYWPGGGEVE